MNLYIRLFGLFLKIYFRANPTRIIKSTVTKFRVLPNDLDLNWHMNNGRYLTVMDLGRLEFIARLGLMKYAIKYKWAPIAGGISINYLRPLKLWQKYTITTQCISYDEKWFYLAQRFDSNGKVIAVAMVKALFRGINGNIPPKTILKDIDYTEDDIVSEVPEEFAHLFRNLQQIN